MASGRLLVAGCGFLGQTLARLALASGWEVGGVVLRGASRLNASFPVRSADLSDPDAVAELRRWWGDEGVVWHCASSGRGGTDRYRAVFLEGIRNLSSVFPRSLVGFTSSTSVYGQTGGEWVDEQSPTLPQRETGRILLESETVALHRNGFVLRAAGLYGPNRSVYVRKLLDGTAVLEDGGGRWINMLHIADAAGAVFHLASGGVAPGIYNASDGNPVTQRDLYTRLAARLARPVPPEGPADTTRKRGWTSKRISIDKLRGTGWSPLHAPIDSLFQGRE